MSVKTPDETIQKIRDMRAKLFAVGFISKACGVSTYVVQEYTKDMGICLKGNKKNVTYVPPKTKNLFSCITYPFSQLPQNEQDYYNDLGNVMSDTEHFIMVVNQAKEQYLRA